MGKYDNGVLGGIENLAILMREECDVYHYSLNPEFTKVSYDSCPLEIGASITPTTGYIEIIAINESSNDVQVVVKYCDYLGKTNKAYFSLGQEIKFGIMSEDDHTPDNYYISNCHLSIASKKYAMQRIEEHEKDTEHHYIRVRRK